MRDSSIIVFLPERDQPMKLVIGLQFARIIFVGQCLRCRVIAVLAASLPFQ